VPTACDQAAVDASLCRFFVDVIGQWHIASAEVEDFFLIDNDRAELMYGAGDVIFKVNDSREADENCSCSYCSRSVLAAQRRARIALTFAATSSAFKISLMIAAESAPAFQTSWMFASVMPPMATIGRATAALIRASISNPRAV
jgi:hypothetical protein